MEGGGEVIYYLGVFGEGANGFLESKGDIRTSLEKRMRKLNSGRVCSNCEIRWGREKDKIWMGVGEELYRSELESAAPTVNEGNECDIDTRRNGESAISRAGFGRSPDSLAEFSWPNDGALILDGAQDLLGDSMAGWNWAI